MSFKRKHWRALVRVLTVTDEFVWCILPGWNHKVAVALDHSMFDVLPQENFRFYAEVVLSAESPDDLKIQNLDFSTKAKSSFGLESDTATT